ncbi:MAG: gluconokinase [Candidatus Pseudobacter hemicellulosilyticus]|uniref:Gluconokinase n=1 Tax=Candidatus Pseudobacter hemicellulosilyticus TaxID=3121375 RepID=A0AAJ5WQS2_9BACT|nr:MAG: gluconokinase [Pseudobacter sp.]
MQFILGIDIGTTNTKAIAFTASGAVIAQANTTYQPLIPEREAHELDPDTLLQAVLTVVQEVLAQTGRQQLAGLSFSSAMHSLMALDADGQPLTRLLTWADGRSRRAAEALKASPDGPAIYQHTGTPLHAMSPLSKLCYWRQQRPALFRQAAKFVGIKEYLLFRLLGGYWIDHSIASATGLFDIEALDWYMPALAAAGVRPEQLSRPVPATTILSGLRPEYARLLELPTDTPIIIGASDGCLANLGSYALLPGDASLTIGTSGAVRMLTSRPRVDPLGRTFSYILADGLYVCGGPVNNGAALLTWYASRFGQGTPPHTHDLSWFLEAAAQAPAGADGLLFLPYLAGERAPVWDAYARAAFIGMGPGHQPAHYMRAVVEGINYSLYQVANAVKETVGDMRTIYVSGGFIRSGDWLQWLTDLFGQELTVSNTADASATGAAILGLKAVGLLPELAAARAFLEVQERFVPDPQQHTRYQQYFKVYEGLYAALHPAFHQLALLGNDPL